MGPSLAGQDRIRGYLAGMEGRRALDTTRPPWSCSAGALIRASHFNEGVRTARLVQRGALAAPGPGRTCYFACIACQLACDPCAAGPRVSACCRAPLRVVQGV